MAHKMGDPAGQLERFREYLLLVARLNLDDRLKGKVDLSGVVQKTMLEAHRACQQLAGQNEESLVRWLRRILANNLQDEIRAWHAQSRDVDRERSLEEALHASSTRIETWLVAQQSSPSQRAMQNERLAGLASALARLPPDQRLAIELHHLRGLPLAQIAEQMDRSKGAVAALLFRGLKSLRDCLAEAEDGAR